MEKYFQTFYKLTTSEWVQLSIAVLFITGIVLGYRYLEKRADKRCLDKAFDELKKAREQTRLREEEIKNQKMND